MAKDYRCEVWFQPLEDDDWKSEDEMEEAIREQFQSIHLTCQGLVVFQIFPNGTG